MNRYILHLAYRGTQFKGWQRQPDVPSIQERLEEALRQKYQRPIPVHGCGRTDAGVHAVQFFAHADLPGPLLADARWVNEIAVYDSWAVPTKFHAQLDATHRSYSYLIHLDERPEFLGLSSRFYREELEEPLLKECAIALVGRQDFRALCRQPDVYRSTICEVVKAQWIFFDDKVLRFDITADRFLRGMVRILVQRMWEVAQGKMSLSEWKAMLSGDVANSSRRAAYPDGLYLAGVRYPNRDILARKNLDLFGPVMAYLDC